MKITELRGKTVEQLFEMLLNLKKESFNLRFQKTTGELAATGRIKEVRRTIAKINTLLVEAANKKEKANA